MLINLSTRWQTAKKEVIFCQFEIVGVRWYGRVQIGKKQVTARKFDVSLAVFIGLSKSPNPTINLYIFKITCGRTTFSTVWGGGFPYPPVSYQLVKIWQRWFFEKTLDNLSNFYYNTQVPMRACVKKCWILALIFTELLHRT